MAGNNASSSRAQVVEAGQTTLDGSNSNAVSNGANGGVSSVRSSGFGIDGNDDDDGGDPNAQLEMENNGARLANGDGAGILSSPNGEAAMAVDRILEKDTDINMT